ncbi:type II toxin-antitoxin system RelE/ParE family toxin [uncultured Pontibacter sp.]|uniref:type II toxin-antitoxin system RelE/ParE family toxin n=1 Tax=uncultured Pontibacter sp. TaxID=453356 RepID=UPI0026052D9B|nr:type II toxin-antitoxin system RelE/ParE family toxin [uncultured Pontibacter sp.]
MEKPIRVVLEEEARDFLLALPMEIRKKFAIAFRKTEQGYQGDWFEKMTGTDGLFEFRVTGKGKWHRILAFWDKNGPEKTLIVGTHGFDKKTNKTPAKEIKKAERTKQEYFAQ